MVPPLISVLVALIAFLGALAAALIGLLWNFNNARDLRKQPFLEKQLALCVEASSVAATLATARSAEAFDPARARFEELFWGPLSIVENVQVSLKMRDFREKLIALLASGADYPLKELEGDSYALALEIRRLILEAWNIRDLGELLERKA